MFKPPRIRAIRQTIVTHASLTPATSGGSFTLSSSALMKHLFQLVVALFALLPASAQDAPKGRTILILDASGSMWGKIGNKTKIEIARETATELIKNRPAGLEMGFMAYGHRRKGDCEDIELIVPPGTETTEKLLAALDQLLPKGMTPIHKAVLQAAQALKYTEQAASVILVSDGLETCGGNLTTLGKLLASQGVDFKTHIIGFAMKDADTVDLRALAKATGGLYADAGDAASLAAALQSAVVAVAKSTTTVTLVPIGDDGKSVLRSGVKFALYQGKKDEKPLIEGAGGQFDTELAPGTYLATATFGERTIEASVTAEAGRNTNHTFTFTAPVLTLQAVLNEGAEPLTDGVSWGVFGPPDAEGKRPQVAYSYDATAKLRLGPGDYRIVANRGSARVEKDVRFGDQPLTVPLVFGAGTLHISATPNEGAEAITGGGLSWAVLGDPDSEGKRPQIAFSYDAQPKLTLPAGSYLVNVTKGSSTVGQQIEVKAGQLTTAQIVMGSGVVATRVVMSSGLEPVTGSGLSWEVLGNPNAEGKRPQVAFSYDAAPRFTLPAGSYTVTVKRGSATASHDLEVAPGKTVEATLNLNAAILKATAVLAEGSEPHTGTGLSWAVLGDPDAEGKRPQVAFSYDARPEFQLPVGSYLLTVKRGEAPGQQQIDVVAGKLTTATINLNAGLLKVVLTDATGAPLAAKPEWSVLGPENAEGKRPQITFSYDKEPTFVLPAGPFLIRAKFGDKSAEATAEVAPGRLTEFTLKTSG